MTMRAWQRRGVRGSGEGDEADGGLCRLCHHLLARRSAEHRPRRRRRASGRVRQRRWAASAPSIGGKARLSEDDEALLILKTTEARLAALIERIRALHSYDDAVRHRLADRSRQSRLPRLDRNARRPPADHAPLGSSTLATAWAAMPSRRPVKPSSSVVVALTLTRGDGDAQQFGDACPHRLRGAAPTFGRSQIRVTSTLTMRPPAAATSPAAWRRNSSEGAPRQRGSDGRKVAADVALADRSQQRVGQRVQADVGIGMAEQAVVVRDGDAAQHDVVARRRSGARRSRWRCAFRVRQASTRSARSRSSSVVTFRLSSSPGTSTTLIPAASATAASSVSAEPAAARCAASRIGVAKALRRLRPPQSGPLRGAGDQRHGRHRHRASACRPPAAPGSRHRSDRARR